MRWLSLLLLLGCTTSPPADAPSTPSAEAPSEAPTESAPAASVDDDSQAPKRIVSLGAGVTEIVYALGHGERVVAADKTSKYPDAAASKATLGFFRRISAEGVLAASPDVVLAGEGTGPPTAVDQLRSAGTRIVEVPGVVTLDDARARIRAIANVLGATERAKALIRKMDADLEAVATATSGKEAPKVLFVYARGGGVMMVAGTGTSAGTVVEAAGGELAAPDHEGFRPLTAEAVVQVQPDVILLTTGGLEAMGGVDGVLAAPGIAATPAGKARAVHAVDDHLLLGMGPRTGEAVRTLAGLLHPELSL